MAANRVRVNQRAIQDFLNNNSGQVQPFIRQLAGNIEREASQNAPVDTGTLRDSSSTQGPKHITSKQRGSLVNFGVEHAQVVETGSKRTRAQEYMRPAVEAVLGRFRNFRWTR